MQNHLNKLLKCYFYPLPQAFFLSRLHMVLLLTIVISDFNICAADTELTIVDSFKIFSISLLVFRDLGVIKSNLSAKVLWLQSLLSQKYFLLFIKIVTCLSCNGRS